MEVKKKIDFIKDWISNYVSSMPKKTDSLVIGISGGIDSSVLRNTGQEMVVEDIHMSHSILLLV